MTKPRRKADDPQERAEWQLDQIRTNTVIAGGLLLLLLIAVVVIGWLVLGRLDDLLDLVG